jgi:uncharacterized membrane protein YhaH (DUF805 family)
MGNLLFGFRGRINRAKFWLVVLGILIVEAILLAVVFRDLPMSSKPEETLANMGPITQLVLFVFAVVSTWISLATGIKRFHDRNKTGWWVLIVLVPIIGHLWYLIECGFLKGTTGPNSYGPDPIASL